MRMCMFHLSWRKLHSCHSCVFPICIHPCLREINRKMIQSCLCLVGKELECSFAHLPKKTLKAKRVPLIFGTARVTFSGKSMMACSQANSLFHAPLHVMTPCDSFHRDLATFLVLKMHRVHLQTEPRCLAEQMNCS